jgi:hypothetical protein
VFGCSWARRKEQKETKLEQDMLKLCGVQSPETWRLATARLLEEVVNEEIAAEVPVDTFDPEELVWTAAAVFKKIKPEDRERIFADIFARSGAAALARRSVDRQPSPPPRAPRAAAVEARQTLATALNEHRGPQQLEGQREQMQSETLRQIRDEDLDEELEDILDERSVLSRGRESQLGNTTSRRNRFRDPGILWNPQKWNLERQIDTTSRELEDRLLQESNHDKLSGYTREVVEIASKLAALWYEDPSDLQIPELALDLCFRARLWAKPGATNEAVEAAMGVARSARLPLHLRRAEAAFSKKAKAPTRKNDRKIDQRSRSPETKSSSRSQARVPKEVWDALSPQQRKAIMEARK